MNRVTVVRPLQRLAALAVLPAFVAAGPGTSNADLTFAALAGRTNLGQIALSQIAMSKSGNSAVDAYAGHLYADFDAANGDLQNVDNKLGLPQPGEMDPDDERLTIQLRALPAATAERDYIAAQPAIYTRIIALYQAEADNGSNGFIVAYARKTLRMLQGDEGQSKTLAADAKRNAVPPSAVSDGETVPTGH